MSYEVTEEATGRKIVNGDTVQNVVDGDLLVFLRVLDASEQPAYVELQDQLNGRLWAFPANIFGLKVIES